MRDEPRALSGLLEPGATIMVGNPRSKSVEFRPLTVARVEGDRIEILVDTTAEWVHELAPGDAVVVTLSDTRTNTWLSLVGSASMTTDSRAIDEIWSPMAGAYFDDGRDSPGIAVLRIDGERGAYWTAPSGRIGSLISMVKAKVMGADRSGDHGRLEL